jgi:hypothetical protein
MATDAFAVEVRQQSSITLSIAGPALCWPASFWYFINHA